MASIETPCRDARDARGATSGPTAARDKWTIVRQVGAGATAQIFLARPHGGDPTAPADYALKRLRPELSQDVVAVRGFRQAAICGSRWNHSHIVPILDARVDEMRNDIIMPFLHGSAASSVLEAGLTFTLPQALWITRQMVDALGTMHAHGWSHGDVKPSNIVVDVSGHATLIDFDFAVRLDEGCVDARYLRGSLAYVAPERLTSRARSVAASDVYSLGVTLFEMIAGRKPFESPAAERLVESHLREQPPSIRNFVPHAPRSVALLLAEMLAKSPERRPAADGELYQRLCGLEAETFWLRS